MIEGGLSCEKQRTGCQSISDTDGFSGRNETGGKRRTSLGQTKEINGFIEKERDKGGIKVRTVDITKEGAELSGKKQGRYVTIEAQGVREHDSDMQEKVTEVFAEEFSAYLSALKIPKDASCLIVGLGNWNVTPDALGPLVTENLLVTRHLFRLQPENVQEGYRLRSARLLPV